jgi:hypothetical protein
MSEARNARPRGGLRILALLAALLIGSLVGSTVSGIVAPASSDARVIGALALPAGLLFGMIGWFWLALSILGARFAGRWLRPGGSIAAARAEARGSAPPPGSIMFVPASFLAALAAGIAVALMPGGSGFLRTVTLFCVVGLAWGWLLRVLARRGMLPPPEAD